MVDGIAFCKLLGAEQMSTEAGVPTVQSPTAFPRCVLKVLSKLNLALSLLAPSTLSH